MLETETRSKNEKKKNTRTIFGKFFSRKFSLHSTLLPENLLLSVEWFAFGNSTVSGISGNFSWKFLYHLPPFPNCRKFWLNGKRPLISRFSRLNFEHYFESLDRLELLNV